MTRYIEITLDDPREDGNKVFSNIVDPINISVFISRIKDLDEKRSFDELIQEFLQGR